MTLPRLGTALAAIMLTAAPALAQTPNWRAQPVYGTLELSGAFSPDPQVREVRAGGTSRSGLNDCPGYLNASAPDLDVRYAGSGTFDLTFSAASRSDVAILVHTPDDRWFCDDDGADAPLNAKVTVPQTTSGTYSVWVLTYANTTDRPTAYVGVSEVGREVNENDPFGGGTTSEGGEGSGNRGGSRIVDGGGRGSTSGSGGSGSGMPDWTATPLYGQTTLRAGFRPDPYVQDVTAGGSTRNPVSGSGCVGYINTAAPDFAFTYTAGSLPLNIYAKSDDDTSLVVYTADGRWICDDDSGDGLNPHIRISNPQSGSYQVWVGVYSSGSLPRAQINISELSPRW